MGTIGDYCRLDDWFKRPVSSFCDQSGWLISHSRTTRDGNEAVFSFDLPGVKKENIRIEVSDGRLCCEWKRGDAPGKVSVAVGDVESASARLEDGVLTVRVKEKERRRLEVKVE